MKPKNFGQGTEAGFRPRSSPMFFCCGKPKKKKLAEESKPILKSKAESSDEEDDDSSEEDESSSSSSEEESSDDESRRRSRTDDDLLRLALGHLTHREIARGYGAWFETTNELRLLRRGISYLRNAQLGAGWRSWCEEHWRLAKMAGVAKSMVHSGLLRGFNSLRAHADAAAAEYDRQHDAKRLMRNRERRRVWMILVAYRDAMEQLRVVFAHLRNRQLSAAWSSWLEAQAEGEKMYKALSSLMNRDRRRGWNGWMEHLRELAVMRRVLGFARNQLAAKTFRAYLEFMDIRRAERADTMKRYGKVRVYIQKWRKKEMSVGWVAWAEMVAERKAKLRKLRKSVSHMRHKKRALMWAFWSEKAIVNVEFRHRLQKAMTPPAAASGGFMGWGAATPASPTKVFLALRNFKLRKGLNGWFHFLDSKADKEALLERSRPCIGRLKNRTLARGFLGWLDAAEERAEMLRKLRKGVGRMLQSRLAAGLAGWKEVLASRKAKKKANNKQHERAGYVFFHAKCSRAFNTWKVEYAVKWQAERFRESERWYAQGHAVFPKNNPTRPASSSLDGQFFDRFHDERFGTGHSIRLKGGRVVPFKEPRKPGVWTDKPKKRMIDEAIGFTSKAGKPSAGGRWKRSGGIS